MKTIKEEQLDIEVDNEFDYRFEVNEDGLYSIEIVANARSWWQNFVGGRFFSQDDDLWVKVDNISFSRLDGKEKLYNGEASWNGGELKGLSKTNLILINLEKGEHFLKFFADQSPRLEYIKISQTEKKEFSYSTNINNPPQDGDRRPWMAIVLANISLKRLEIIASADKKARDGEDIKLIIDGKIVKNKETWWYRNWYWCGKILEGQEKEFAEDLNLSQELHYIELWADKTPHLSRVRIKIGETEETLRTPTEDNPLWTGDFKDDSDQMILARAIFGEGRSLSAKGKTAIGWVIKNRVTDGIGWPNNYHEVILQDKQFDAFKKEDKNRIFVENPLEDASQEASWRQCYEIAGKIVNDRLRDPTNGANHYFSDYIDFPYWTKTPEAELKIKIGNTLFYELKRKGNEGFSKITFLFFVAICLGLGTTFFIVVFSAINQSSSLTAEIVEADRRIEFFIKNNKLIKKEKDNEIILDDNKTEKSHLKISPKNIRIGYFASESQKENEFYKDKTELLVVDTMKSIRKKIYTGDYHTSDWNWLDEKEAVVYSGCGTECEVAYLIDTESGKTTSRLQYGVGYEWSPSGRLVAAYNYSNHYGITVGNRSGETVFSIQREYPAKYHETISQTKLLWSPDSKKIALLIRKEEENKMELMIFDVEKNFKLLTKRDADYNFSNNELKWENVIMKILA